MSSAEYMNIRKRLFQPRIWLLLVGSVLLSAEALVRVMGVVDFPLYQANAQVGYIPAVSQQGSFLNRNDWEFNSLHMGAPEFAPGPGIDVLLVGDSVVYGGNAYRQPDRLGPALQASLPVASSEQRAARVWPIAAGSWALRNELAWLRQNPQVAQSVESVLFVLNNGDFDEASSWSCDATHPLTRPKVALWYLFNKYVYTVEKCGSVPAELQVQPGNLEAELKAFLAVNGSKTVFVLYPDKDEVRYPAKAQAHFAKAQALFVSTGASKAVSLAGDARWRTEYYKDGIHPTPAGNRVLAGILANVITSK